MIDTTKVINAIRVRGPLLPTQLTKVVGGDTMIVGAVLSDLVRSGQILISHTKVGGSPLYYLAQQRSRLQSFSKHLNEKDQKAYALLKSKGVLRDRDLTPLLRVSLRNIKDFSIPIEVIVSGNKEIFWRWYMVSSDDAAKSIRAMFAPQKKPEKIIPKPVPRPVHAALPSQPRAKQTTSQQSTAIKSKPWEGQKQETGAVEEQKQLAETDSDDKLHRKIKTFFKYKHITVQNLKIIRKGTEIDYQITVPSAVGRIEYFCKAKSKKRINDNDLASVFVKGQIRKMPAMFVITGELTKKALEMLETDFHGLKVVKI